MEGMIQVAKAYYERSSEQDQKHIGDYFQTVDSDGNGKVGLLAMKKVVQLGHICNEKIFKQLDKNRNGVLDFFEFLPVYYMVHKADLMVCAGCYALLSGPYFSCLLCLGKPNGSFNLCCDCHRIGETHHEHPASNMMDNHALLAYLRNNRAQAQKSQAKREMDELRAIAKAHYKASSEEIKTRANNFFKSMDTNGDNKVELSEFLDFMRHKRYFEMQSSDFFAELDQDNNGSLDFSEVMALYYIIKSGRPFCKGCKRFIRGVFFSCVECFKPPKTPFNLCLDCYQSPEFAHKHGGRSLFLDNYTLLEATRNSDIVEVEGTSTVTATSTQQGSLIESNASTAVVPHTNNAYTHYPPYYPPPYPAPNFSNAIVPATATNNKWEKWRVALQALEVALQFGTYAGTSCTIL